MARPRAAPGPPASRASAGRALEDVRRAKSGWTRGDLTAAINAALPDYLGLPDGEDIARLLDTLTDEALPCATALDAPRPGDALLPAELRLRNGRSVYEAPGARLYATPDQVRTERALLAATTVQGAAAVPMPVANRYLEGLREAGIELGVDQAAAVRGVLTSGARVECLVGPAGTGKSFVLGALAHAWTHPGRPPQPSGPGGSGGSGGSEGGTPGAPGGQEGPRRVFGLATSQVATAVLAAEGLTARNVARWLATQDRLSTGPAAGRPGPVDGDQAWALRAGDLVVVDESAMTDTPALAAIHRHVDAAGAKLLLVGGTYRPAGPAPPTQTIAKMNVVTIRDIHISAGPPVEDELYEPPPQVLRLNVINANAYLALYAAGPTGHSAGDPICEFRVPARSLQLALDAACTDDQR